MIDQHELYCRDVALNALGDVRGKRILDVGCGEGIYMDELEANGAMVYGQDIHPKFKKDNILVSSAEKLLFGDEYFDVVFSADFIEHIDLRQKYNVFSEIYRVLKPEGLLVIKTPNLDYLRISSFLKPHIPHTCNNPDNEHCGLINLKSLTGVLFAFEDVTMLPVFLDRGLPKWLQRLLYGNKYFTDCLIVRARKPKGN